MWECCGPFILTIIFGIILIIVLIVKDNYQKKSDANENKSGSADYIYLRNENPQKIAGTNLDRFFIECVLSDCYDFHSESNKSSAKKLADKYNLSYATGIEALFDRALNAHQSPSKTLFTRYIAKLSSEEEKEHSKLTRYAEYYGTDKKTAMLRDSSVDFWILANKMDKYADEQMSRAWLNRQKEGDWAIMGGIANGLAGPAAGIATALDIQAKNTQISAQNKAAMRDAANIHTAFKNNASAWRAEADRITEQIVLTSKKQVSDMSPDKVLELLNVKLGDIKVSDSGAFKVSGLVSSKQKLVINDSVPAVADGTISADVYDGEKHIGSALMVLPLDGVSEYSGHIEGICLSGAESGKAYTVKFSPYKLWLMEQ